MAQAFELKGQQYSGEEFIRRLEKSGQLPTPEELEKSEDPRFKHLRYDPLSKGYTIKPFDGEFRHPDPTAIHPAPYSALTPAAHSAVHREIPPEKPGHAILAPNHASWDEHQKQTGLKMGPNSALDETEFESAQRRFFKTERYGDDGHPVPVLKPAIVSPYTTNIWGKHERTERTDGNINVERIEKLDRAVKAEKEKADKDKEGGLLSKVFGKSPEKTEKTEEIEKIEKIEKAEGNDKEGGFLSKNFGKSDSAPEKTPEKTQRTPEQ